MHHLLHYLHRDLGHSARHRRRRRRRRLHRNPLHLRRLQITKG